MRGLGRERRVRLFRFVEEPRSRVIDLGPQRTHGNGLEVVGRLHHAVPVERIDHVGIRGDALGRGSLIQERVHGVERTAMLMVAHATDQCVANEGDDRAAASAWALAANADLLVDEAKQRGQYQPGDQQYPDDRVKDVNEVPRVPAVVEGLEQTYAVRGGVVEQEMTQRRDHRNEVQVAPADREFWPARGGRFWRPQAQPQAMHAVHQGQRRRRHERHADEAVGNSAMVLQGCKLALQHPEHVDIGGFGGQHHGQRGESAFAIKARTRHAGAGQKMRERIQVVPRSSFVCSKRAIVRRWSEFWRLVNCRSDCWLTRAEDEGNKRGREIVVANTRATKETAQPFDCAVAALRVLTSSLPARVRRRASRP